MSRYPKNFIQDLGVENLALLPPWATYEGNAPDLQHLKQVTFPAARAQELVYVGERENVWVEDEAGNRWQPWLAVMILEVDAHGNPVLDGYTDAPSIPEHAPGTTMTTADLGSVGMTDAKLASLAKSELAETYKPEPVGPSKRRKEIYDRVMAALYATD